MRRPIIKQKHWTGADPKREAVKPNWDWTSDPNRDLMKVAADVWMVLRQRTRLWRGLKYLQAVSRSQAVRGGGWVF